MGADVPLQRPGLATTLAGPLTVEYGGRPPLDQPTALAPTWASPGDDGEPPGMPFLNPHPAAVTFAERRSEREEQRQRLAASYESAQNSLTQMVAARFPNDVVGGTPSPSQQAMAALRVPGEGPSSTS